MAAAAISRAGTGCTTAKANLAGAAAPRSSASCRDSGRRSSARSARRASGYPPSSPGRALAHQPRADARIDEFGNIAAEHRDLANQGGGDEHMLLRRRKEDGLEFRKQAAVHSGELELVLEVGHGAKTPHHHAGAGLPHEID